MAGGHDVYRGGSTWARIELVLGWVVLVLAVTALTRERVDPGLGGLLVAVIVAGVVRAARVRIEVSGDGLLVRNFFRSHRLSWREIRSLESDGWACSLPLTHRLPSPVLVVRTDAKRVAVTATARIGKRASEQLMAAIEPHCTGLASPVPEPRELWTAPRSTPPVNSRGEPVTTPGWVQALGLVVGAAVVGLGIWAIVGGDCFGRGPCATDVDWDLTGGHTASDVHWPQRDLEAGATTIGRVGAVRIKLPGRELAKPFEVDDIHLTKRNGLVDRIQLISVPLEAEEVRRAAVTLSDDLAVSRDVIDQWFRACGPLPARIAPKSTLFARAPAPEGVTVGAGGPRPAVSIRSRVEPRLRWILTLELSWRPSDLGSAPVYARCGQ